MTCLYLSSCGCSSVEPCRDAMHPIALQAAREAGVRGLLIYCGDYKYSRSIVISGGRKKRHVTGLARTTLFLFRADSADALDGKRRAAGSRGDLAVLFENVTVCGLVTIQPAEQFRGHAPVGTLRPILIDDVEKGELAFGIGSGLFRHGRLLSISALKSKENRVAAIFVIAAASNAPAAFPRRHGRA